MRLGLILCVLALTAFTFYSATLLPQANDDTAEMQALVENAEALSKTISDLEAQNADQSSQILAMAAAQEVPDPALAQATEQLTAVEIERDNLIAMNADLDAQVSLLTERSTTAEEQLLAAETGVADLSAALETEQARFQTLEAELSASENAASNIASLKLADMQSRVDEANTALAAAEKRILSLTADADEQADIIATLTSQASIAEGTIASLRSELAAHLATMASIEIPVANEPAEAAPSASFCTEQVKLTLGDSKVEFDRGTATISSESIPVLSGLVDVARQCADAELVVEIGGHTDSRGGERSNQTLSESRARAVLDFLYAEGVPSVAMRAVGYGESQPIADNGTSEGRSENRRITFAWQQR